ncbi:MAG: hypothetical protein E6K58_11130 [Nitrospirae bacterium]|nr:MAG: hypothetical protein E6K58_11130 [Nitrospirota bacterium]
MGERGYGQILAEAFARAIPWALVFSVTVVFTAKLLVVMIAPEIKKGIEYGANSVINATVNKALGDDLFPKIKQNTKEAIEYAAVRMNGTLGKPSAKGK